jgi:hypothetical protein
MKQQHRKQRSLSLPAKSKRAALALDLEGP